MIIHKGYEDLHLVNPVVTLGIFDGVHLGHRALLNLLVSRAKEVKGESVVITFSPHPKLILNKGNENLTFLSSIEEKEILLDEIHIGHLVIIEFNESFSKISARNFIKDILVDKIGIKHLILGYNHHFGKSGEGDFNTIKECAGSFGFKVEQIQGFYTEEGLISSSSIREALLNGKLDDANRWLGYCYSLRGIVVTGRKIGRSIGFPTANIKPGYTNKLIPSDGVYAVEVQVDEKTFPGMLSIGSNPTVNDDKTDKSIEVHILNYDENIYGKTISVIFRKRLRDEKKFENTGKLAEQMNLDKQEVLRLLT
jgi:riboflavin kinase / FMN adenylyltransferase